MGSLLSGCCTCVLHERPCVCADDVRRLCEAVGLQVLELEYACVLNRNRKKGTEMRRVFVHALAIKPHASAQVEVG